MADLRDLIERVEKLDEPDRFTDEMIWEAVGGWPAPEYRSVDYMRVFGTPLTASLDAAIALCERKGADALHHIENAIVQVRLRELPPVHLARFVVISLLRSTENNDG